MIAENQIAPAVTGVRIYPDNRMRARDAAQYLGLSYKVLATQRTQGSGPPYYKAGKFVFYKRDDLDEWMDSCRTTSTAQYRQRNKRAAP